MATKGLIPWATWGLLIPAILLVMSGSMVVAAPTCGQHEYLENSQCLPCPTCPPGYGVSGPCGSGRGALTTCTPCEPNPENPLQTWPTFSDSTSQEKCQPCHFCDNSHYSVNCSADANSHCGPCLYGYFRTSPDEKNCVSCEHVSNPYQYLCQDWLDAQITTTLPTSTEPITTLSSQPHHPTTEKVVAASDKFLILNSSDEDSSQTAKGTTLIIVITAIIAAVVLVVIYVLHRNGIFKRGQERNSSGQSTSTHDDTTEFSPLQGANTAKAEQQPASTSHHTEVEDTDSITPGVSDTDLQGDDRDGSKEDSQNDNSSPSTSSTSSLDTENGAEGSTLPKSQGDANDCSDPSSGTELLKDQRRYKSHNKRASYGSHSQKSRLSSQLSPSSSSSEGSINGIVEGGASCSKQNNAIPCRAASQLTVVHWSGQGGTAEVLLQHQNASNQDVHKGSRPVVELHDGRLVNQTARPQSEPATERFKTLAEKMEMTEQIQKLFVAACDKFGDQGLEQLPEDARDKLSSYLDPQPDPEGAYSFWKHLVDRFNVERDKLQNLQGMRNLLQLLQTKNNCTIRELLQNVASIERFDALEAVCLSLLQDIEYSLQDTCISNSVI